MIFLIVFGFIAVIVISLNIMDSSNLEKIENHFKEQNCKAVVYAKGSYKGICEDYIMEVPNSFNIDIPKSKKILKLDDINEISKKGLTLIINEKYRIEFKEEKNLDKFYNTLKGHLDR